MISNLPIEIQNKIYSYVGEHPLAIAFKKEIEVMENIEHRRLYWKANDEWFHTTHLTEDGVRSFIIDDNIKTNNIGRLTMSKNDYNIDKMFYNYGFPNIVNYDDSETDDDDVDLSP